MHRTTPTGPFYYYLIVLAVGTLWYLPLYPRLLKSFKREWIPLFLWFSLVLIFFSLASNKLHHYILFAYPPLAILLAHVVSRSYLRLVIPLSLLVLFSLLPILYAYQANRFTPKAYPIVKAYQGPVYFYKAEDSALVYYSERCIERLEDPLRAKGLVITKENHTKELPSCKLLLKGREFDGVYALLDCGHISDN